MARRTQIYLPGVILDERWDDLTRIRNPWRPNWAWIGDADFDRPSS